MDLFLSIIEFAIVVILVVGYLYILNRSYYWQKRYFILGTITAIFFCFYTYIGNHTLAIISGVLTTICISEYIREKRIDKDGNIVGMNNDHKYNIVKLSNGQNAKIIITQGQYDSMSKHLQDGVNSSEQTFRLNIKQFDYIKLNNGELYKTTHTQEEYNNLPKEMQDNFKQLDQEKYEIH